MLGQPLVSSRVVSEPGSRTRANGSQWTLPGAVEVAAVPLSHMVTLILLIRRPQVGPCFTSRRARSPLSSLGHGLLALAACQTTRLLHFNHHQYRLRPVLISIIGVSLLSSLQVLRHKTSGTVLLQIRRGLVPQLMRLPRRRLHYLETVILLKSVGQLLVRAATASEPGFPLPPGIIRRTT